MAKTLRKFIILVLAVCVAGVCGIFAACSDNDEQNTEPETYTVSFNMQGHGAAPSAQSVEKGGYATKPATDPTETGYDFGGWYKEAGCTNVFIFNQEAINADTTVYAKWTEAAEAEDPDVPETAGAPLHFYDTDYDGDINGTAFSLDNTWHYVNNFKNPPIDTIYHYNVVTIAANSAVKIFWHINGYEAGTTYKFDVRVGDDFAQDNDIRAAINTWYSVGQNAEPIYKAQAAFGLIGMQVEFTEAEIETANQVPSPMCNVILQNTSDEAITLRIICAVGDAH